jgi:predicted RND superfamily exporter protein
MTSDRVFRVVTARPLATVAIGLALIVAPAAFLPALTKDTRNDAFARPDDPAIVSRDRIRAIFGLADPMVVAVVRDRPNGIYTPATLRLLARLTRRVAAVPGIDPTRVRSLATESAIVGTPDGLEVRPLMPTPPADAAGAAALGRLLATQEIYLDRLVARDGTAALVVAELRDERDAQAVYERLAAVVADTPAGDAALYVAGEGAANGYVGAYIDADAERLNPLAALVVVGVLFVAYQTGVGVLVPCLVVVGALTMALGTMAATGVPFYLITSALTVILIGVSVCDAIHLLGEYYERLDADPATERTARVVETMTVMWAPITVTSVTSMAGFLCMGLVSTMPPLRAFGIFATLGVAAALFHSLVTVPALLCVLRVGPSRVVHHGATDGFGRTLAVLGRLVLARPKRVLAVTAVLVVASAVGASFLRLDDERIRSFQADEPIVRADAVINERLGGTNSLDILVEGDAPRALYDPGALRRIDALQRYLESLPRVRRTVSIVDWVKQMHRAMHDDDPAYYAIPDDARLVAQYFLLYSMTGDPEDFETVLDADARRADIRVTMDRGRWSDFAAVVRPTEAFLAHAFHGTSLRVTVSGSGNARLARAQALRRSHPLGVALAFVAVFVMTALALRSATAGLLCVVPVAIAVLATYATMGALGIWLGLGTSMAAAIAIGLAVDFAVHVLTRLRVLVRHDGCGLETALARLYPTTGRALLFNFAAVFLGFGVLAASRVPAIGTFGLLVAACVAGGFLASLTVLPVIVALVRPAFLATPRSATTPADRGMGAAERVA